MTPFWKYLKNFSLFVISRVSSGSWWGVTGVAAGPTVSMVANVERGGMS